ncbi:4-hydroxy-tetrahydrodipicolinate synthase [bacterium]|nr:4-hydroxy-tetrahydrodipicolinate synthase [bacterium]MBU1072555.1 4-hydroxy-tetrahydrodipicolinate synthase [bacterium]MBU1674175.1 4-hydroxy-tetrahydrodipicolinate synthase [bacterium]
MTESRYTLPPGIYTALVTPFADGAIDRAAWERLVDRQVRSGVAGLVPVGCTGEAATLSVAEREWLVRKCVELAAGRCAVVAGTGTNATASTLELTREAAGWGIDAAMLIAPYYNKPQQHGLIAHYASVADAVDIPLVIYNVPGRTAVNILPETVRAIAGYPNVVAVKEASGDLRQIDAICRTSGLQVFSGDDGLNLEIFRLGGQGAVSVLGNLLPRTLVDMWKAWCAGDEARAAAIAAAVAPAVEACFRETNPVPAKELLSLMGYCRPDPRLPLATATAESRAWLRDFHDGPLAGLLQAEA